MYMLFKGNASAGRLRKAKAIKRLNLTAILKFVRLNWCFESDQKLIIF